MDPIAIFLILWLLLPFVFLFLWLRERSKGKRVEAAKTEAVSAQHALETRYAQIISVEDEVAKLRTKASDVEADLAELRQTYAAKRAILQKLEAQVAIYDERLSFAELGVYEPHFDFSDSEAYKAAISAVRERQKDMVSSKTATICPADWTVDGSKSKGQTMVNRQTRLTMRAFNNECEAAIANTRWNNVNAMEKRIQQARYIVWNAHQIFLPKPNPANNLAISSPHIATRNSFDRPGPRSVCACAITKFCMKGSNVVLQSHISLFERFLWRSAVRAACGAGCDGIGCGTCGRGYAVQHGHLFRRRAAHHHRQRRGSRRCAQRPIGAAWTLYALHPGGRPAGVRGGLAARRADRDDPARGYHRIRTNARPILGPR